MKVAIVALNFHLDNTHSSSFLIEILRNAFEDFHVIRDGDAWYEIPRLKPDVLVVFQRMYSPAELECFGVKNIVLVPMYDACPNDEEYWSRYRPYKILCFSMAHYNFLKERSFDVMCSQYYSKPAIGLGGSRAVKAFYWERSALIDWSCIKTLIGDNEIEALHYHRASNISGANPEGPDERDIEKYHITISDWFETQEEYLSILDGCSVYFAPRESEGIGHSFIEALSRGLCVVAPDAPTMNEYITNGINGILYDPHPPVPVSFTDIDGIRGRALAIAGKAYERWVASIPGIIDFVKKPLIGYAPRRHLVLYLKKRGRAMIRKLYKTLRRGR